MNEFPSGPDLSDWKPVHSATSRLDEAGRLIINDGDRPDWHLLRVEAPEYCARITLKITAVPLPDCNAELYVNHWGGVDVCRVASDGRVIDRGTTSAIEARRLSDGSIELELTFLNDHPTVSVGTSRGADGRYAGEQRDQYAFSRLEIWPASFEKAAPEQVVTFVDVGASTGLKKEWRRYRNRIQPVVVTSNPTVAATLRDGDADEAQNCPKTLVVEATLSGRDEERTSYLTRHPEFSSLLSPDHELLKRYSLAPIFEAAGTETVVCTRYDTLWKNGAVPTPDVVRIDARGTEFEVLEGFGDLLRGCLAVELKASFYPLRQGQKLIGDLVTYLDGKGLSLRALRPVDDFDGDAVEFDAFFTRRPREATTSEDASADKLRIVESVWGLTVSDKGKELAKSVMPRKRRIVLAGHSHIIALSGPHYSETPSLVQLCSEPEVVVLAGRWPRGDDYWQALIDASMDSDVALIWGGNEHNIGYFFEADHAFDFVSKQVGRILPSFQVIPKSQIRRRLTSAGIGQLAEFLARFPKERKGRLAILGTPPPKRDNDALRALLASEPFFLELADRLGHTVETVPITAPHVRLKLWYLLQEMLAEQARQASAIFVPVPQETQDEEGFLRPDLWAPDVTHANEIFGHLLFRDMLAALDQ